MRHRGQGCPCGAGIVAGHGPAPRARPRDPDRHRRARVRATPSPTSPACGSAIAASSAATTARPTRCAPASRRSSRGRPNHGLEPVYAATHILNGYGELIGINSIREVGHPREPDRADELAADRQGLRRRRPVDRRRKDPDGRRGGHARASPSATTPWLSAVLQQPLADEDVWAALDDATAGAVEEGCVGSGVGMQCFDFKGGIGTASRVLPSRRGRLHGRRARHDEPRRPRGL